MPSTPTVTYSPQLRSFDLPLHPDAHFTKSTTRAAPLYPPKLVARRIRSCPLPRRLTTMARNNRHQQEHPRAPFSPPPSISHPPCSHNRHSRNRRNPPRPHHHRIRVQRRTLRNGAQSIHMDRPTCARSHTSYAQRLREMGAPTQPQLRARPERMGNSACTS